MTIIRRLKVINFMSYPGLIAEFPEGAVCVVGSNMSGKTTFARTLLWALSGSFEVQIGQFTKERVRPAEIAGGIVDKNGHKPRKRKGDIGPTVVEVTFEVPKENGRVEVFQVTRSLGRGGNSKEELYLVDPAGYRFEGDVAQNFIFGLLGVPEVGSLKYRKTLLSRKIWYGVGQQTSLFSAKGTERKEIIESLNPKSKFPVMEEETKRRLDEVTKKLSEMNETRLSKESVLSTRVRDLSETLEQMGHKSEPVTANDSSLRAAAEEADSARRDGGAEEESFIVSMVKTAVSLVEEGTKTSPDSLRREIEQLRKDIAEVNESLRSQERAIQLEKEISIIKSTSSVGDVSALSSELAALELSRADLTEQVNSLLVLWERERSTRAEMERLKKDHLDAVRRVESSVRHFETIDLASELLCQLGSSHSLDAKKIPDLSRDSQAAEAVLMKAISFIGEEPEDGDLAGAVTAKVGAYKLEISRLVSDIEEVKDGKVTLEANIASKRETVAGLIAEKTLHKGKADRLLATVEGSADRDNCDTCGAVIDKDHAKAHLEDRMEEVRVAEEKIKQLSPEIESSNGLLKELTSAGKLDEINLKGLEKKLTDFTDEVTRAARSLAPLETYVTQVKALESMKTLAGEQVEIKLRNLNEIEGTLEVSLTSIKANPHMLPFVGQMSVPNLSELQVAAKTTLAGVDARVTSLRVKVRSIEEVVSKVQALEGARSELLSAIPSKLKNINSATSQSIRLEAEEGIARRTVTLSRLDKLGSLSRLLSDVDSLSRSIKDVKVSVADLERRSKRLTVIKGILAPNGDARTMALGNDMATVVTLTNSYLAKMGLDRSLAVDLTLEKEEDGRPAIELKFEVDGSSSGGRISPSNSQLKIVGICMDLAVMKMGDRDSFVIIDEPEEGLDDANRSKVTKFLKEISPQTILVTNTASAGFDNIITTDGVRRAAMEAELSEKDFTLKVLKSSKVAMKADGRITDGTVELETDSLEDTGDV